MRLIPLAFVWCGRGGIETVALGGGGGTRGLSLGGQGGAGSPYEGAEGGQRVWRDARRGGLMQEAVGTWEGEVKMDSPVW